MSEDATKCPKCGAVPRRDAMPEGVRPLHRQRWICGSWETRGAGTFIQSEACRNTQLTAQLAAKDATIASHKAEIERLRGERDEAVELVCRFHGDVETVEQVFNIAVTGEGTRPTKQELGVLAASVGVTNLMASKFLAALPAEGEGKNA